MQLNETHSAGKLLTEWKMKNEEKEANGKVILFLFLFLSSSIGALLNTLHFA